MVLLAEFFAASSFLREALATNLFNGKPQATALTTTTKPQCRLQLTRC
jgi:hypothetical protein